LKLSLNKCESLAEQDNSLQNFEKYISVTQLGIGQNADFVYTLCLISLMLISSVIIDTQ
jgi:hypothetical protein